VGGWKKTGIQYFGYGSRLSISFADESPSRGVAAAAVLERSG
jgi:hypothetical protein